MAAELSALKGWLTKSDVDRVREILRRANLPVAGPRLGASRYLELMAHDKKVLAGRLRLVLLAKLGEATTSSEATRDEISTAIDRCCT